MKRLSALILAVALSLSVAGQASAGRGTCARSWRTVTIGYSVSGAPIIAYHLPSPGGKVVLAVGGIHGDESGAVKIPVYLHNAATVPKEIDLWVIEVANPDGFWANRRQNDNLVDLNRNFATDNFASKGAGTEKFSGPSAASEPETRALQRFILRIQPRLVVWWHQVNRMVDDNKAVANYDLLRLYGRLTGWPLKVANCAPMPCRGTATGFVNSRVVGSTSFVVEMPKVVTDEMARSHAEAFLWIALAS